MSLARADTTDISSSSRAFEKFEQQPGSPPPEPTGEHVAKARGASARQGTVSILVLGRSGAGKTYFIDYACQTPKQDEARSSLQGTTDTESRYTRHSGATFKLIDTPGFDGLTMSDSEVFTKIADYLLNPSRMGRGINGIIYIHQAGDALQSRTLQRNLGLLSDLILGETGLARLTIFMPLTSTRGIDPTAIVDDMRRPGSIFGKACAAGAKIMAPKVDCPGFMEVMMSYATKDPIVLPIQQDSQSNFLSRLKESTWYYEKESAQKRVKDLETSLNDKELELEQYQEAYNESEKLHVSQQEPQIVDNIKLSEIVQDLRDLNRDIDDFGRLISAHIVDNHVQATFGKDIADVTALDARDLPGLKSLLRHTEGKPSLIASGGVGMDVESFLDFSIRTLLCALFIVKIFQPFHPGIDQPQGEALSAAYEDIQKREPQSIAGKWRSNTFKSIYRPKTPDVVKSRIDALTLEFMRDGLGPLLALFLGKKDAILERDHYNRLHQLVTRGWNWNSRLKGEVMVLGDFEQVAYIPPSGFDDTLMEEFEPSPRKRRARQVLGTLGLGLVLRRAVGGGQSPEESIVCKVLVATDNLYA